MAETTHFGERTVPLEDKQGLVNDVFHAVADRYDLITVLLSFGQVWRTGANEATSIQFIDDVTINGQALPTDQVAGAQKWTGIVGERIG